MLLAGVLVAAPLGAQQDTAEEDAAGGPLVRLLENTLSGDNRKIQVVGLEGALSARATIERIVVSDDDGPWLTVSGAVLDWNRLALVRGRFSVNALTADEIILARQPKPSDAVALPTPEAAPFALPELPVSIEIGEISIARGELGEPLIGEAAELTVTGNLTLADGALDTRLAVDRLDQPGDRIGLQASYSNETRLIGLDLRTEEDAGGLISELLNIPGAPPLTLTAVGAGPLEDFGADIALATDGQQRVTGQVALKGETADDASNSAIAFSAELGGDVTVLMDSRYHAFFGSETHLDVSGRRYASGEISVDALELKSNALDLTGAFDLAADRKAAKVTLNGQIALPDGASVTLPMGEPATSIRRAQITLDLDSETSDAWSLDVTVDGLARPDLTLDQARVTAGGTVDLSNGFQLSGTLETVLNGLAPKDRALRRAVGDTITLAGGFALPGDGTLSLSEIRLNGDGYDALVGASIQGLNSGFFLSGSAEVTVPDLTQFSGLAGRPLSGSLVTGVTGSGTPLGGSFDIVLSGTGTDLTADIAQLDRLLKGDTLLSLDAGRNETGLALRDLTVTGTALRAEIRGQARSGRIDLDLTAALDDLGRILPDIPGPVRVKGTVNQRRDNISADLEIDAPQGAIAKLNADVKGRGADNIVVGLTVSEPAGGSISALLQLPGRPALDLSVQGAGPLSGFDADIALSTGGVDRLEGQVSLAQTGEPAALQIAANLGGDLTPLLPVDYHDFFGTDSDLALSLERASDGRINVDKLSLTAQSMTLNGTASLTAEGQPEMVDLTGRIRPTTGQTVRLPVPGGPTTVRSAAITANLDATKDNAWRVILSADGLTRAEGIADSLAILGDGKITLGEAQLSMSGALEAAFTGVQLVDPGMQQALGPRGRVTARFDLPGDDTLDISDVRLNAAGLSLAATAKLTGLSNQMQIETTAELRAPDLDRFSPLTGLSLGGDLSANLRAKVAPGAQSFDGTLTATGSALRSGIAPVDAVLVGDTVLTFVGRGDTEQVQIDQLDLTGGALSAKLSGTLGQTGSDLVLQAELDNLGRVVAQVQGPLTLKGTVTQDSDDWLANIRVDAPQSYADLKGRLAPSGDASLDFDTELAQLELLLPDLAGRLAAKGRATRTGETWQATADLQGPADIAAQVSGQFDQASGEITGTTTGRVALGAVNHLINPMSIEGPLDFDLSIAGPPELGSVTGQLTTSNVSIAIPQAQNTVNDFRSTVTLNGGQAELNLAGNMRTGGGFTITGPIGLDDTLNSNVTLALQEIGLTDELSYRSTANGQLVYSGPLIGDGQLAGRIDIGETEINAAAAGGGVSTAPIPQITHIAEPGDVYQTRVRAGLVDLGNGNGAGPNVGLDIEISAPNRVYVRGYGLNAELGGALYVRGTTQNVAPSGQIGLIRGSMNVLGRNLDLSRGLVTMQGSLEPYLEFAVTTTTQEGSATMAIVGELDDLEINISSDPERPEEEALAMLVFGNEFATLSPIRLAQMALYMAQLRSGGDPLSSAAEGGGADRASLSEDSSGTAALGLGGYVAENIYTDVSVNADGDAELNINLDVSENLTVKGSVNNEGETGLGLFFERDY